MQTTEIWKQLKIHRIPIVTVLSLILYTWLVVLARRRLEYWRSPEYDGYFSKKGRQQWLIDYKAIIDLIFLTGPFQIILLAFFFQRRKELFSGSAPTGGERPSALDYFFKVGSSMDLLMLAGALVAFVVWIAKSYQTGDAMATTVIDGLLICVALAAAYKYVVPYFAKHPIALPGILRIVKELVLYLPCLILRLVDWVKFQYKITTKTVWILLGVEVALIVARFLIPWIMEKVLNHRSKVLLRSPVYLDKEHPIGTYESLHADRDEDKNGPFSYNYAISGWFYLNPQPPNVSKAAGENTPILDYGGKPTVFYNGSTNTLTVTMQKAKGKHVDDGARTIHLLDGYEMPLQRWNHIVLNMKGGSLDIFINGELVMAAAEAVPVMSFDNLVVGSANGVQGAVANVHYYKDPMSLTQVSLAYNAYRWKTPPV